MVGLNPGVVVVVRASDDWPEHRFLVWTVEDDCVTGTALTGPLAGSYGEPDLELILRVVPLPNSKK
jgi:hypothetical protein